MTGKFRVVYKSPETKPLFLTMSNPTDRTYKCIVGGTYNYTHMRTDLFLNDIVIVSNENSKGKYNFSIETENGIKRFYGDVFFISEKASPEDEKIMLDASLSTEQIKYLNMLFGE